MILRIIRRLAALALSWQFAEAGVRLTFDPLSSRIKGYRKIFLGDRVHIGPRAYFSIHERLDVGDDVMFGPDVMILSGNHKVDIVGAPMNMHRQGINAPCEIERDVWIGARVIILGRVKIGEGAVIGANSLVNKDVPPYTIAFGNPCRPKKERFTDEELREHLVRVGREESYDAIRRRRSESLMGVWGQRGCS